MRQTVAILSLALLVVNGTWAVVYVDQQMPPGGLGISWATAVNTIQEGIDIAAASSAEVWVAAGSYEEFVRLEDYVHVYGGFSGYLGANETDLSQRDIGANPTHISNAIVIFESVTDSRLDGFTIDRTQEVYGSGVRASYCDSSNVLANCVIENHISQFEVNHGALLIGEAGGMQIRNCALRNNSALRSGAACVLLGNGSPLFVDCVFDSNVSRFGGAVFLVAEATPTFDSCTFTLNQSISRTSTSTSRTDAPGAFLIPDGGGAVYAEQVASADDLPHFLHCVFFGNYSDRHGGALTGSVALTSCALSGNVAWNSGGSASVGAYSRFVDCQVENNVCQEGSGGGLEVSGIKVLVQSSRILGNQCGWYGGGLYVSGSCDIVSSLIEGNSSPRTGGGVESGGGADISGSEVVNNMALMSGGGFHGSGYISDSTFTGNRSGGSGGGIAATGGTVYLCEVSGNVASEDGGGIAMDRGSGYIHATVVHENECDGDGGGVALFGASLWWSVLRDNVAGGNGGGLHVADSASSITNTMITRNRALRGGGLSVDGANDGGIHACVIASNEAVSEDASARFESVVLDVSNNTFTNNWGGIGGIALIDASPVFTNNLFYGSDGIIRELSTASDPIMRFNLLEGFSYFDHDSSSLLPETMLNTLAECYDNISGDPHFRADGIHLEPDSPAIDMGLSLTAYWLDIDRQQFGIDVPGVGFDTPGRLFDIGADEYFLPIGGQTGLMIF